MSPKGGRCARPTTMFTASMSRSLSKAPDAQNALLLTLHRSRRTHQVLRLQRGDDLVQVQAQADPARRSVENSMNLLVLRPSTSIFDTSGTCSSRERASST